MIKMHMPKLASVRGQTLLTDTKPYLFRQSPVVAEMLDDMLTGGTVAWNQLIQNGDFSDGLTSWEASRSAIEIASDGSLKATTEEQYGGARNLNLISRVQGHKYLTAVCARGGAGGEWLGANDTAGLNGWFTRSLTTSYAVYTLVTSGTVTGGRNIAFFTNTGGDVLYIKYAIVIDLTQMFGSQIADYVYSLEQSTAGSGIAWLKEWGFFTKDFYPYDAGSLLSVKTSGHKTVGFNQWDEEWELGDISASTGENTVNSTIIRSKNYIKILPNTVYFDYVGGQTGMSLRARFYDAEKNYIGYIQKGGGGVPYNGTFTTPDNAYYMRFTPQASYGATYNNDICINISNVEKNGTYEPYEEHVYPLDNDLELRGIPKLTDGQMYFDGDEYRSDGTVTRKYGIVDLGTLDWSDSTSTRYISKPVSVMKPVPTSTGMPNIITEKYKTIKWSDGLADNHDGIAVSNDSNAKLYLYKDENTSTPSGYLVYELATPTTETTDPFTNPQTAGSTEEYIDERTVPMPVGHTTEYFNMVQKEQIQMHMPTHSPIKMHMEG